MPLVTTHFAASSNLASNMSESANHRQQKLIQNELRDGGYREAVCGVSRTKEYKGVPGPAECIRGAQQRSKTGILEPKSLSPAPPVCSSRCFKTLALRYSSQTTIHHPTFSTMAGKKSPKAPKGYSRMSHLDESPSHPPPPPSPPAQSPPPPTADIKEEGGAADDLELGVMEGVELKHYVSKVRVRIAQWLRRVL